MKLPAPPCGAPVPPELCTGTQALMSTSGKTLLRSLVAAVLPLTPRTPHPTASGAASTTATAATGMAPEPAQALTAAQRHLPGAWVVSALLLQAGALPGGGQRLTLGLALGSGGLGPRLWSSALAGVRAAEVGGPGSVASALPGAAAAAMAAAVAGNSSIGAAAGAAVLSAAAWDAMVAASAAPPVPWPPAGDVCGATLPLVMLSRSFTAALAVSDVGELTDPARSPLPVPHMWDASRPEAGLVALLRERLWGALWTDPQGLSSSAVSWVLPATPSSFSAASSAATAPALPPSQSGSSLATLPAAASGPVSSTVYSHLSTVSTVNGQQRASTLQAQQPSSSASTQHPAQGAQGRLRPLYVAASDRLNAAVASLGVALRRELCRAGERGEGREGGVRGGGGLIRGTPAILRLLDWTRMLPGVCS